jgi:hypothetical protein
MEGRDTFADEPSQADLQCAGQCQSGWVENIRFCPTNSTRVQGEEKMEAGGDRDRPALLTVKGMCASYRGTSQYGVLGRHRTQICPTRRRVFVQRRRTTYTSLGPSCDKSTDSPL